MNEVKYSPDHKYAYVDGYKFRKDKSGYYLSTKKIGVARIRLHRYIWEKHNGSIPKGYEINHIDENKDNNEISNFECITAHEHRMFHLEHDYDRLLPKWQKNLQERAIPAAAKWHQSAEGKAMLDKIRPHKMRKKYVKKCIVCGKSYRTAKKSSRFCSGKCRTRYRSIKGLDDITAVCPYCHKEFQTNKYRPNKFDTGDCRSKYRLMQKIDKKDAVQIPSGKYVAYFSYKSKKYHTKAYQTEKEAYDDRNKQIKQIIESQK
ncbi:HNH endonuclease signature motif containing protein [Lactobacillus amylovorus]|uniref:HNH endonuclease signature motif containing protein n=1 Tax=Lactobacillus amylovorus TaxID=1604 RepID=UPI00233155B7|nr:HNH endonuclease signature motif containing protein [Lactobacillus amylovorus]MDB6232905.1 HNH endonuclease [Lactobacillus amylovorus]